MREEIRRKVKRIDVYAKGVPESLMNDLPLAAPGWPAFKISFVNGCNRWVFNPSKKPTSDSALLDTNLPPDEMPEIGPAEKVFDADEVTKAIEQREPLPKAEPSKAGNNAECRPTKGEHSAHPAQLDMVMREKAKPYRVQPSARRGRKKME